MKPVRSEIVVEVTGADKAAAVLRRLRGEAARTMRACEPRRPLWSLILSHGIVAVVAVLLALLLWAGTARAAWASWSPLPDGAGDNARLVKGESAPVSAFFTKLPVSS